MKDLSCIYRIVVLLTVWLAPTALADGEESTPAITADIWPALTKLVIALAFILVIIYASVWLMKRFSLGKLAGNSELISIVERRHLAPKQAVYLLKVGSKHLLVGSSEAGITRIADIDESAIAEKAPTPGNAPATSTFNRVLRQARETFMPMLKAKTPLTETESE